MGIARAVMEQRSSYEGGLSLKDGALLEAFGGRATSSGVRVNASKAMTVSAVYDCVKIISEDIAKLPLKTYKRLDRGKAVAEKHPVYTLLHDRPNPWMTAFNFREAMQACILLWGNNYAEIEWNKAGRPVALWPVRPDMVEAKIVKDARGRPALAYLITDPETGRQEGLPVEYMNHVPGLSFLGFRGLSVIGYWREAIGLTLAASEYGSRFFANDTTPGLILTAPRKLNKEEKETLKEDFRIKYEGLSKKFRMGILEQGWDIKTLGMKPQDAQYLELRKFQILEVCRMFRMPPHKIASMDAATYTNIEHQGIEYKTDTIQPWTKRAEQVYNWKLFGAAERGTYFCEHVLDALLQGDTAARTDSYQKRIYSGNMTPNEAREKENENPLPGGDDLWMPMNMIPASMAADFNGEDRSLERRHYSLGEIRAKRGAALRRRLAGSYRKIFEDAAARMVKREVQDVGKAAKKMLGSRSLEEFEVWLEDYYRKFPDVAEKIMLPAYASYAEALLAAASQEIGMKPDEAEMSPELEAFTRKVAQAFVQKHAKSSQGQLGQAYGKAVVDSDDPLEAIEGRLGEWEEKTPAKVSMRETVRFGGAFARAFFFSAGVVTLVWVAGANACPLCREMDGKSVGRMEPFIRNGDEVNADGVDPLRASSDIGHPPLHDGCECTISPG
ncbi:MAG: phage portal protein [Dehalococcoidia bacterium]|nr:phage portal protein [Dehalococcoidia bacterium]